MNKWLYYVIQWTWGLVMNLFGVIVFLALQIVDLVHYLCTPHHRHYIWFGWYRNAVFIALPWDTGAISLGMFIICGKYSEQYKEHEYGHSIQNMQWGPLFLFVIGLPSLFRCWYRTIYYKYKYTRVRRLLPDYDSIWFEGQATQYGKMAAENAWKWI